MLKLVQIQKTTKNKQFEVTMPFLDIDLLNFAEVFIDSSDIAENTIPRK